MSILVMTNEKYLSEIDDFELTLILLIESSLTSFYD